VVCADPTLIRGASPEATRTLPLTTRHGRRAAGVFGRPPMGWRAVRSPHRGRGRPVPGRGGHVWFPQSGSDPLICRMGLKSMIFDVNLPLVNSGIRDVTNYLFRTFTDRHFGLISHEADGDLGKRRALTGAGRRSRPRRRVVAQGFPGSGVNAPAVGSDDEVCGPGLYRISGRLEGAPKTHDGQEDSSSSRISGSGSVRPQTP
jgi:hypothetical protein